MKLAKQVWLIAGVSAVLLSQAALAAAPVVDASASFRGAVQQPLALPAGEQAFVQETTQVRSANPVNQLMKINQLQNEVRTLRGKLEVQSHDIKMLQQQTRSFYKDLDTRINQLVGSGGTQKLNQGAAANSVKLPVPQAKTNERQAYNNAYSFLKKKKFAIAKTAMKSYLQQFPRGKYAANAHYWLGEIDAASGDIEHAITEFNTVVLQFSKHPKTADAMLKLGLIYSDLKEWDLARNELQKLRATFPKSTAAHLAQARLQKLANKI